jgi:putative phage-type endonuclease
MDPIYILLKKIDDLINNNVEGNKIENIILNDKDYIELESVEQEIINKILKIKTSKDYVNKHKINMLVDNNGNNVSEGEALSSITNAIILNKISKEEFKKRSEIFNTLKAIILPEQRSPEWFAMRNGKITASDGGAVLGKNKHEPSHNFILKKVFGSTFETNLACYHGKKLEYVVTIMYEYLNDVHTEEFGLLGHPDYYFLGASPDGICSPYCRDMITPNPLVGRMLEIKCPLMRKIKYKGNIIDNICPVYYWCQVQLQLECCDLDECDFLQCNIEEYNSRKDFLEDTNPDCDYKSIKYGLERGVLIELLPNKLNKEDYNDDNDMVNEKTIYDKTSFLYPPKIDMSIRELDNWVLEQLSELQNKPEVRLNRILYWRLIERNCTLIKRDKAWFAESVPKMETMWKYVEFLRKNSDVAQEWKAFIQGLNIKNNEKILNKLRELIAAKNNKDKPINDIIENNDNNDDNNNDKNNVDSTEKIKKTKINKTKKVDFIIEENINLEDENIKKTVISVKKPLNRPKKITK